MYGGVRVTKQNNIFNKLILHLDNWLNDYSFWLDPIKQINQFLVDFNFNNATISFATAPTSAWLGKFFVIAYGEVLNSGIPSDGVITNAKLAVGTVEYSALSTANKATILSNSLIFGN